MKRNTTPLSLTFSVPVIRRDLLKSWGETNFPPFFFSKPLIFKDYLVRFFP
jgi:hypothetical protein